MNGRAREPAVSPTEVPFGKYVLHRRLGAGGMGEVWLATLPGASGIDKPCVVKRLLGRHVLDEDHVRMFLDEARISISLQHGNVVPVIDFGEVQGTYYLAMDWVRGKDLAQILRRARREAITVPLSVCLLVAIEICRGLAYAHEKVADDGTPLDIVHRDVSPANVLCSYEGDVKIADFGIARTRERWAQTAIHQLKGKAPYMSPEQARGEHLDARADQFATGVILFEMLTGARPHEDRDKLRILERRRAGAPVPPPSSLRPDVSERLDGIVTTALAPRPEGRHPNMRELQIELGQELARVAPRATSADLADLLVRLFPRPLPRREAAEAPGPGESWLDPDDLDETPGDPDDADLAEPPTAEIQIAPGGAAERAEAEWGSAVLAVPAHVTESATVPPSSPRGGAPRPVARWAALAALSAFAVTAAVSWWPDPKPRGEPHRPAAPAPAPAPNHATPVSAPEPARADPVPAPVRPAPAPAPAPATDPEPAAPAPATGRLEVVCVPWAEVWVDGRRRAESTPVTLRLGAGTHLVRLTNPELGLRRDERVEIRTGQTTRLARRLR